MSDHLNNVGFLASNTGMADIEVGSRINDSYALPSEAGAQDGKPYTLRAKIGNDVLLLRATYVSATDKFTRGTVLQSIASGVVGTTNLSIPAGTAIEMPLPAQDIFPSGTKMVFHQTAAPTGWTKETGSAYNDVGLRIVTGTVGSGGTDDFSTTFSASKATDPHTLTLAQMMSHGHGLRYEEDTDGNTAWAGATAFATRASGAGRFLRSFPTSTYRSGLVESVGSGNSHSHPIVMDLKYQDVIVATKD